MIFAPALTLMSSFTRGVGAVLLLALLMPLVVLVRICQKDDSNNEH